MSVEIIRDQWVCVDCLMFIANGELPESESDAQNIVKSCEAALPYVWVCDGPGPIKCSTCEGTGVVADDDSGDTENCDTCQGSGEVQESDDAENNEFSWASCDCCDSRLGGSRHRCALIRHDAVDAAPTVHA